MNVATALRTYDDYELFLYTLPEQFGAIRASTVVMVRRGATMARVVGELRFDEGYRLVIRERLIEQDFAIVIDWYGYEVWHGDTKLFWYDPQPHPDDPRLASTEPHHKHVPPDIKHNRVPAPGMSFDRVNIPDLIGEVEALLAAGGNQAHPPGAAPDK